MVTLGLGLGLLMSIARSRTLMQSWRRASCCLATVPAAP